MKLATNNLLDLSRHGELAKNQSVVDSANSIRSLCVFRLSEWFIEMDEEMGMIPHVQRLEKFIADPSQFPIDIVDEEDEEPEPEPPSYA